ncbi:AMP-binding enzyme [Streptomyces avermitilis]|uniref:AMP-binding enzyme n=1 Tax=Streptomyces avermitilis TaxID=33903 RepID=UPI003F540188
MSQPVAVAAQGSAVGAVWWGRFSTSATALVPAKACPTGSSCGYEHSGRFDPKAFVVTADPALTADEVMTFVAAQVAPYKKVRAVEFLAAIPKSPAGKILRKNLRNPSN